MRRYVDKTGGLEIEKFDEPKSKSSRKPVSEKKEAKPIKATDMLDTAISYQQAIFVAFMGFASFFSLTGLREERSKTHKSYRYA